MDRINWPALTEAVIVITVVASIVAIFMGMISVKYQELAVNGLIAWQLMLLVLAYCSTIPRFK